MKKTISRLFLKPFNLKNSFMPVLGEGRGVEKRKIEKNKDLFRHSAQNLIDFFDCQNDESTLTCSLNFGKIINKYTEMIVPILFLIGFNSYAGGNPHMFR